MRYLVLSGWLIGILILGVVESVVALPVFSIGLLFLCLKNLQWWQRVLAVVLVGIFWGAAMAITPALMVFILMGAVWLERGLGQTIQQRSAFYIVTIGVAVLLGILRAVPVTTGMVILSIVQWWLFWLASRHYPRGGSTPQVFLVPAPKLTTQSKS